MCLATKAIILDSGANILVLHRSASHPLFPHHLDFPGGTPEKDEVVSQALSREILEETGLIVKSNDLKLTLRSKKPNNSEHTIYTAKLTELKPKINLSWEHDAYEWLPVNMLLQRPIPENPDDFYEEAIMHISQSTNAGIKCHSLNS